MASQSMAGRANQKLRTRTAIVQAAAELSRTGRDVTMPEIARAALVSEATAYRYFPDLASLLREAIAGQLPAAAEALQPVADSDDPVERVAAATEFLLRHVLARQGVVRALIAATITRPGEATVRPGVRFGLIDQALAPLAGTLGTSDPAALTQLKRDLAVVISADALFSLLDLYGLHSEDAITSIVHTAMTLTSAALRLRDPQGRVGRGRPGGPLLRTCLSAPGEPEGAQMTCCLVQNPSADRCLSLQFAAPFLMQPAPRTSVPLLGPSPPRRVTSALPDQLRPAR